MHFLKDLTVFALVGRPARALGFCKKNGGNKFTMGGTDFDNIVAIGISKRNRNDPSLRVFSEEVTIFSH
jgi:hypothetical protein